MPSEQHTFGREAVRQIRDTVQAHERGPRGPRAKRRRFFGRARSANTTLPEDVGNCACVVGVGVHEADESPPFYWKSCHRFVVAGLGALVSAVPGFPTLTDDQLAVTRHATDPQWDSDTIERTCPGISPSVSDDYAVIVTQETYGWKVHFRCVNGGAVNCDDEVDWVFTTPSTL